jgi:hypothetical protein
MNKGSSNNIPVLSYKLHFRLTAIIHDEWRVIVLVVVIAAVVEVELQYKKLAWHQSSNNTLHWSRRKAVHAQAIWIEQKST